MTYNGYYGISPIEYCKKSLALSMAAEQHGISFFENSASPSGFLSTDQVLTKEASERLLASWNAAHQGVKKAGKVAVLEQNLRFERMGADNREAQLVETRNYSRSEIAALFGVPSSMLNSSEGAKYNNVQQMNVAFHTGTLSPLISRIEQEINRHLPDGFEIRLDDSTILRGDPYAEAQRAATISQFASTTPNTLNEMVGLDPVEGGDERIQSTSMVRAPDNNQNEDSKLTAQLATPTTEQAV